MSKQKELLHGISTTSLDLAAVLPSPNSNRLPLHSKLERNTTTLVLGQKVILHIQS
jgi:hypothetical protein